MTRAAVRAVACAYLAAAPPPDLAALKQGLQSLVERVSPAVVQVLATSYAPAQGPAAAGLLSRERGTGSGVVLDPSGYVVTNAHVVEGARRVQVALAARSGGEGAGRSILKASG